MKIERKPAFEATLLVLALLGLVALIQLLPARGTLIGWLCFAALMWWLFYTHRVARAQLKQLGEERDKAQA